MKNIPVINKSRKKSVEVKVIPSDAKEEVPTPPKDYKVKEEEDVWNEPILDDFKELGELTDLDDDEPLNIKDENKALNRKHLAEALASLEPQEMRQVIKAAKHLRKFVECLSDEDDEFQDKINKIWEA